MRVLTDHESQSLLLPPSLIIDTTTIVDPRSLQYSLPRLVAFLILLFSFSAVHADAHEGFIAAVNQLPQASYAEKADIVKKLVVLQQPGTKRFLQSFLDGALYVRTADNTIFLAEEVDGGLKLADAVTQEPAGTAAADGFEKIGTNNGLRKVLRSAIAQFDLGNSDGKVRLSAVNEMLRSIDDESIAVLRTHLQNESNRAVKKVIDTGLALADISSGDRTVRIKAVETLGDSLNSDAYNALQSLLAKDADGRFVEKDTDVQRAALEAVSSIDAWRKFYSLIETMFFGLSLGSVLVLAAIGLAITFGVMGVINMAHGELMMLGAYTTYVVQLFMPNHIGASVLVAIPLAFLVCGATGILIERGLVRFLYGRPLETLLATFGVSLVLQQIVRDIFSANNRPVETPQWMAGSWQINEALAITLNRLYIVLFTFIVFAALLWILKRTRLGLNVRAVAQNRAMARAMGVRSEWVDAMTFGLGSGIAGVAGVALSQLTNVGPNLGQQYIVDSFMVVVFGGVGNLWGTMIGGMSLGVVNKVLEPYSGAVLAKIFVLIALILFIQRRPRGLFPQKGRAAEH